MRVLLLVFVVAAASLVVSHMTGSRDIDLCDWTDGGSWRIGIEYVVEEPQ